jgi:hypothetical protein
MPIEPGDLDAGKFVTADAAAWLAPRLETRRLPSPT